MPGKLVVLSGPSGVGKDTVIDRWHERNPKVKRVVACTTRDPRPGENNGEDYFFLSREEFFRRADAGEFLEHKEVHGEWYATPLDQLHSMQAEGLIAILKIDVQGAFAAKALKPDLFLIFLAPPSMEELRERLVSRGTDSPEKIELRLKNAEEELRLAAGYDAVVINDDVEKAVNELEALVA